MLKDEIEINQFERKKDQKKVNSLQPLKPVTLVMNLDEPHGNRKKYKST
jgi:hypothetical protein